MEGDVGAALDDGELENISIHTLRVEGDEGLIYISLCHTSISIHTLRVEGDVVQALAIILKQEFQSTPSVWRVTACVGLSYSTGEISIHTLRVEGDL